MSALINAYPLSEQIAALTEELNVRRAQRHTGLGFTGQDAGDGGALGGISDG